MKKFLILLFAILIAVMLTACVSVIDNEIDEVSDAFDEVSDAFDEASDLVDETIESVNTNTNNDINPDFKAAMDEYEKFFNEYVDILKKYTANPSDMSVLSDYVEYTGEYADMMETFYDWEDKSLNSEEMSYYLEVLERITNKLLEVSY